MARISSRTLVAGLTAGALAVIAALAAQASGSVVRHPAQAGPTPAPSASATASPTAKTPDVPARSGSGKRVVYGLAAKQVWLVDDSGKVVRTYGVAPGTVDPPVGRYRVGSRTARGTGGDGVPIEHVVRFATVRGVAIGFSAASDGSMPSPDPQKKTGGVREKPADGEALWQFATIGCPVVVVR